MPKTPKNAKTEADCFPTWEPFNEKLQLFLEGLTDDQKLRLNFHGVGKNRISEWKSGARIPTTIQVMLLCTLTKTPIMPMMLAALKAKAERSKKAKKQAAENEQKLCLDGANEEAPDQRAAPREQLVSMQPQSNGFASLGEPSPQED